MALVDGYKKAVNNDKDTGRAVTDSGMYFVSERDDDNGISVFLKQWIIKEGSMTLCY